MGEALGAVWKTAVVMLGCLVAADIAGAVIVTVVDILPLKYASVLLAYAIWLVLGVFCGVIAYSAAGAWASPKAAAGEDWSAAPDAGRVGTIVLVAGVLVVAGLAALFWFLTWRRGVAGDDYVPDSWSHTATFFAAVVGALALGRFGLTGANKPPGPVS